jgi:hypothetical protein
VAHAATTVVLFYTTQKGTVNRTVRKIFHELEIHVSATLAIFGGIALADYRSDVEAGGICETPVGDLFQRRSGVEDCDSEGVSTEALRRCEASAS